MTFTNIGHSFTADNFTKSGVFDTFINVQKRRETVEYKSSSSINNLNLAYVQGQAVQSDLNLSIRDRSTVLAANRSVSRNVDTTLESVTGFNIETEQFLTTDIFTDVLGNQPQLPLFYQHDLNLTLGVNESFVDIQVLDSDFKVVTLIELKIDTANGLVYNNLANEYNQTSGISKLFYVTYLVKNSVTGVLTRFTELLSNEPVFHLATLEDLDAFGNFLPGVKAYILQEDITATFNITLPSLTDYGVRRLQEQRFRVLPPPVSGPDDPWFVTVQNSSFISSVDVGLSSDSILKYRVAEFLGQSFDPFAPYKFTTETSERVNRRTVKTIHDKIAQVPDENLYVDIYIYDSAGTIRFALTSDPSKVGGATSITGTNFANVRLGDSTVAGTEINNSSTPISGSSIDKLFGFILLPAGYEMDSTDTVQTDYYYEEDKYEFSFINLNPLSDSDLIDQRVVLFVRPESLGSTLTQTLFYLVVDEDGKVVESNYNLEGVESSLYDGLDVQTSIDAGELWYDRDPSTVPWLTSGIDFVDSYTVQGTPNQQAFFILGEVYAREAIQPNGLNLNDIRIRGGGLDPDEQDSLEAIQPEASWNWDVANWDGQPYPGAASLFVDIPVDVLDTCSGLLTAGAVKGIINQHIGYGIYPVIHKYNDYEPTIIDTQITNSGIFIEWTEHPSDAIFDVYTSTFKEGPWSHVASGLQQVLDENSLQLPILISGVNTFVGVTGKKGTDGAICFSGPIDIEDPGYV